MKICPLALTSGHTYYCNSSCALSSDGECLVEVALKKYINTPVTNPYPHAEYPNSNTGKDSHSDYWDIFAPSRETKAP